MICHFDYGIYFTKYEFSEIKVRFLNQPTGYHSTGVAYALSLVFYGILGILQYHGGGADMRKVAELSGKLANIFNLNPLLLLPPVSVIVSMALKAPALLGLSFGIFSGAAVGLIFQPACNIGSLFISGMSGYSCESSVAEVAKLLNRGGLTGMMYSVSMCILAMMFGGIMEDTRMMETIINKLKPLAKTPAALVVMTEITAIIANFTMCAQYIAIIVPGRMFSREYQEAGLCIVGQEEPTQWYQYTFIDEYTRFRYLEAFPEHSTYSSALFIQHCVKRFPTPSNACKLITAANSQIGWLVLKISSQHSLKKPWSSLIFVTS